MKFLILIHFVILWIQVAEFQELKYSAVEHISPHYALAREYNDLRGIKDLWNKIKNRALDLWDHVKNVAQNTKEKILDWAQNVKKRAKDITKALEDRLKKVKDNIKASINNIIGTNEKVRQCLKERNKVLEDILKQIFRNVTVCISNNVLKLSSIENVQDMITINDTRFNEALEKILDNCDQNDINEKEQCLYKVNENILDEIVYMETRILKNRSKSRSDTDDILEAVISCSVDGLIKASSLILKEAVQITVCILNQ